MYGATLGLTATHTAQRGGGAARNSFRGRRFVEKPLREERWRDRLTIGRRNTARSVYLAPLAHDGDHFLDDRARFMLLEPEAPRMADQIVDARGPSVAPNGEREVTPLDAHFRRGH